jgi:hypothetical protein
MQISATMKLALCASVLAIAGVALVAGCAQKRTQPVAQSGSKQVSAPVATARAVRADDPAADREKRPRFGESVVYVDGKPVGVVRASELPTALQPRVINLAGGYETKRWGFLDYARALGIDTKRIKAMHLYGGSRAVVVDRAELTRIGEGITFSFVQGDRGKARVHWPPVKLNTNSTIDMLSNVAFYVEKEPPVLRNGELVMPDGTPIESKVPYAPEEQGNGTRIYVDGKLVGTVKRKNLTSEMLVTGAAKAKSGSSSKDAAEDRYSLLAYAAHLRPDAKQATSIDLVAGDDVIARLSPEAARALTFDVPRRNRGQAVADVPSGTGTTRARISAVQIYVRSTPPPRAIVAVDDAPEAVVRMDQGGSGSDDEL